MRLVEVKDIPHENRGKHSQHKKRLIETHLQEFMAMNVKFVRVEYEPSEYAYPCSCRSSLYNAIRSTGLPVRAVMEDGVIYLMRTDM
jgi:hypothetical protein